MKVNGLYVSEWDDGIEIQSEAVIDLETKEVAIGKHLYDYDFDSLFMSSLKAEQLYYIYLGRTRFESFQEGKTTVSILLRRREDLMYEGIC